MNHFAFDKFSAEASLDCRLPSDPLVTLASEISRIGFQPLMRCVDVKNSQVEGYAFNRQLGLLLVSSYYLKTAELYVDVFFNWRPSPALSDSEMIGVREFLDQNGMNYPVAELPFDMSFVESNSEQEGSIFFNDSDFSSSLGYIESDGFSLAHQSMSTGQTAGLIIGEYQYIAGNLNFDKIELLEEAVSYLCDSGKFISPWLSLPAYYMPPREVCMHFPREVRYLTKTGDLGVIESSFDLHGRDDVRR